MKCIVNYPFPCCGYKTLDGPEGGSYVICPVCFWEDDPVQLANPDLDGCANPYSLKQSQQNFLIYGACDPDMKRHVRKPNDQEARDDNWRPL